jgi:hypothetical protein
MQTKGDGPNYEEEDFNTRIIRKTGQERWPSG